MFERQLTRIDTVRQYVDEMLKACEDSEEARCGYVHLYGVGQACALIALRRGHDRAYAELAEMDEILKDTDVMQHWLRNPVEEYFFAQPRVQKLIEEFQLSISRIVP